MSDMDELYEILKRIAVLASPMNAGDQSRRLDEIYALTQQAYYPPALRSDRARLDWLNGRLNWFTTQGPAFDPHHKNIREAIDAAMAAHPHPNE